jgi:fatty acid desaturase
MSNEYHHTTGNTTMKKNMGTADRAIRVTVALVVAYLIYAGTLSGTWAIVAGIAAGVFVLTSVVSFCPLYAALGMSTCRTKGA